MIAVLFRVSRALRGIALRIGLSSDKAESSAETPKDTVPLRQSSGGDEREEEPDQTDIVLDRARQLGSEITETDVYDRFSRACNAFRRDRGAQRLASQVNEARKMIGPIRERGRAVSMEAAADFRKKLERMNSHPKVAAFREAREELDEFMEEVQETIYQGMEYDLTEDESKL